MSKERQSTLSQDNLQSKARDLELHSNDVVKEPVKVESKPEILRSKVNKKSGGDKCLQTSAKDNKKNQKKRETKEIKNRRGRNKQKKIEKYFIDCSLPASDDILRPAELVGVI